MYFETFTTSVTIPKTSLKVTRATLDTVEFCRL